MNTFAALGCGARFTKANVPNCWTKAAALFEHARTEGIHRQPLTLGAHRHRRKNRWHIFPSPANPVPGENRGTRVTSVSPNNFLMNAGPSCGMIVEKPRVAGAGSSLANIARNDSALPLGIEQIPVRPELLYIDELGVVVHRAVGRRTDIVKNILAFRIGILMPLQVPLGSIRDLGQDQRRL